MNLCKGCGRKLRSAKSVKLEYGPFCFKKAQKEAAERQAQIRERMPIVAEPSVEPLVRYVVSSELVKQVVLLGRYAKYVAQFPGRLEVLEYPDHFLYQAENDPDLHESADLTEEPEWFRRVKEALETGVPPAVVKVQEKLTTEGVVAG